MKFLTAALMAGGIAVAGVAATAGAQEKATPASLKKDYQTAKTVPIAHPTLRKLEVYLNNILTAKGRFNQIATDGSYLEGDFYLSRPGKMRLDYDYPAAFQIVANGDFFVYYDAKLGQVTYLDTKATPAAFILRREATFSDPKIQVLDLFEKDGTIEVTLTQTKNPSAGKLTLIFSDSPLALQKWRVVDIQNIVTTVTLSQMKYGVELPEKLFVFDNPKKKKRPGEF